MRKSIHLSVSLNRVHMQKDLGLALSRTDCVQPPTVKTNLQDIPGADGVMDLTESLLGRALYANRQITMEFGRGLSRENWPGMYSKLLKLFHGKVVELIFDDDKGYFYRGRATVSDYARTQTLGTVLITVDAEPYKYETMSSLDPWLWDPFSFRSGVIRNYKDIQVTGSRTVRVIGTSKVIVPVITASAPMKVKYENVTYDLVAGKNKIFDISIGEGEHLLTFLGTGEVSIDYRGGIL